MLLIDARYQEPPAVVCGFDLGSKPRPVLRELPDHRRSEMLGSLRRPEKAASPRRAPEPGRWLEQVYRLGDEGKIDPALDLVLDELDELLYERNTARCDEILAAADVERLRVEVMLGFLMETFRARSALPRRADFLARVERRLRIEAPDRVDRLLRGLR